MFKSGTGQTAAVDFPHSRKNLKGNCTAGNVPQQHYHQEHGDWGSLGLSHTNTHAELNAVTIAALENCDSSQVAA